MENKKDKDNNCQPDKQKFTIYIDPALHIEFKKFCIGKNSMSNIVEQLIEKLMRGEG